MAFKKYGDAMPITIQPKETSKKYSNKELEDLLELAKQQIERNKTVKKEATDNDQTAE